MAKTNKKKITAKIKNDEKSEKISINKSPKGIAKLKNKNKKKVQRTENENDKKSPQKKLNKMKLKADNILSTETESVAEKDDVKTDFVNKSPAKKLKKIKLKAENVDSLEETCAEKSSDINNEDEEFLSLKPMDESDIEINISNEKPNITTKENIEKFNKKKTLDPEQNERTVFVGNIPSNTKVNQLKKLFKKGVVVNCRFRLANGKPILKHKMRKESDSITAWVVFQDKNHVEEAIKLNGSEFKGRHIRITKSKNKTPEDDNDKRTIFVGNLKYSANDSKLYSIFSSCGEVEFVRTINNEKGCSGVGYVCFKKQESVGLALELNKTLLDDRPINVEKYSKNKSGASKKRKPEKAMSGVERRIMSKLMKDKNQSKDISEKLPFKNFNNKRGNNIPGKEKFSKKQTPIENSKKKKEFRGFKVDAKKKFKKKNNKNPFNNLAKKIAPKE